MELRDYITILRDRWLMIVVTTLVGLLAAGLYTLSVVPTYEARSQLYVSVQTQDGSNQGLAQGSAFSQNQVAGFADLATSPLILDPVVEVNGLAESSVTLSERVNATVRQNTSLIDIVVTGYSPEEARTLSNAVAESMASELPELQRPLDAAVSPVKITVTRTAATPTHRSNPNAIVNAVLGAASGLVAGVGLALLISILDTRVRNAKDLGAVTDSPLLASVGYDRAAPRDPLALISAPLGQRAESIRRLRTNLQFIGAPGQPNSIVVTSSVPGEGKSTTAINLALAMADAGHRILLVDGDLRRPTIAKVLGLEGSVGLTTALIGRASASDVVQTFGETTLDVMTSGEIPPNPSEILGSRQMQGLLKDLASQYDTVIIDSAPLLPVTDGAVLARLADGALVVVGADSARKSQVTHSIDALKTVDAQLFGLVLNRVPVTKSTTYEYYDYRSKS